MTSLVYILTNEAMPDMIKIGMTSAGQNERMSGLFTTGVPLPFECVKAVSLETEQEAVALERCLHNTFDRDRVHPRREFFRTPLESVCAILDAWPGAREATETAQTQVLSGTDDEDMAAKTRNTGAIRGVLTIKDEQHPCKSMAAALRLLLGALWDQADDRAAFMRKLLPCSFTLKSTAEVRGLELKWWEELREGLWIGIGFMGQEGMTKIMRDATQAADLVWGSDVCFEVEAP